MAAVPDDSDDELEPAPGPALPAHAVPANPFAASPTAAGSPMNMQQVDAVLSQLVRTTEVLASVVHRTKQDRHQTMPLQAVR